jgi:hypothetical protein
MTDQPMVKHRCPRCASPESEVEVSPFPYATFLPTDAREAYRAEVVLALLGHMMAEHPEIERPNDYIRRNNGWS